MADESAASLRREIEHSASPVARLLGHSLAAALGFVGIALISLIPVSVVSLLQRVGVGDLAAWLRGLEVVLVIADIGLFVAVFLAGIVVFLAEMYFETEARIIDTLTRRKKRVSSSASSLHDGIQ